MVEDVVSPDLLARLRRDFDFWVDESRAHAAAYGETIDGRSRFDVEPRPHRRHTRFAPGLVTGRDLGRVSRGHGDIAHVEAVADLIGPNVKLHHTKINSKLPKSATKVEWHQDFPFTPP